MNLIDLRTVMITGVVLTIICTIILVQLWRNSKKRFNGIGFWAVDFALQSTALLLVASRGSIPDWISLGFTIPCSLTGTYFGYLGLETFIGRRSNRYLNIIPLIIFILVNTYFVFISPQIAIRNLILAIGILYYCLLCIWISLVNVEPQVRIITGGVGIIFSAYALTSIIRIITYFLIPSATEDFYKIGIVDVVIMISYQMLLFLLTYSLTIMVNKRLFQEIQFEEEKFSKAFHSSPNAIILTRILDGTIIDVNPGFERITGYQASEVIGKSTLSLNLWKDDKKRIEIVSRLQKNKSVSGIELDFRKKDGTFVYGLFSADIISLNNQNVILSSISDITEQKNSENEIRRLLDENKLILREVHHRIKNNLIIVKSLLDLQVSNMKSRKAIEALQTASNRVQSIVLLYSKLYQSDTKINLSIKPYLTSLVEEIMQIFPNSKSVKVETNIEDIILSGRIISTIGILINELITNSMKHAFTEKKSGNIKIMIRRKKDEIIIRYKDDGRGLHPFIDIENTQNFGLQLIHLLVEHLRGTISIDSSKGTVYTILFPEN